MNSYSLSVYKITINRRLRKDEKVNLSDFDNGKNFLQLVDSMFISWKDNLNRKVVKDEDIKKVSRLQKIDKESWNYHLHKAYVDGIIESGDYGTQEEIIDIETGNPKYTKTTTDAALVPFYFMIYIEPNSQEGYLILERIGNIGILSVLEKAIREFIGPQMSERLTLNIVPYLIPEVLEMNLSAAEGAKKVILKGVNTNQFKNIQADTVFSDCKTEVSFVAPKNMFIPKIKSVIDSLTGKKENELYKVNNVECQDVAFELDINGSRRTISVAKMTSIGMNIDITKKITTNTTGYPTYKSLFQEAHNILSYLIKNNEL